MTSLKTATFRGCAHAPFIDYIISADNEVMSHHVASRVKCRLNPEGGRLEVWRAKLEPTKRVSVSA